MAARRAPHAGRWVRRPAGPASPRTTVVMPAYRSHATIREAAESALAQSVGDLELVVVDDAAPTPIADALAGVRDTRLGIWRHDRNRNTSGARNTALALARAPLISQLDADDTWEPDYLEHVLPLLDDPRVGLAYCNTHIVGHPTGHDDYIGDPSVHPMDTFPALAEANPVPALTATMRADAVRGVGGYAEWLWACSDWHLYCKLAAAGWRFAYVHRQLAHYRWPSANSKSSQRRQVERSELRLRCTFALRHPLTPGPRRQALVGLRREAERAAGLVRRRPAAVAPGAPSG